LQHGYQESLTIIQKHEEDEREFMREVEALRRENE
jgi:hypothetical protein